MLIRDLGCEHLSEILVASLSQLLPRQAADVSHFLRVIIASTEPARFRSRHGRGAPDPSRQLRRTLGKPRVPVLRGGMKHKQRKLPTEFSHVFTPFHIYQQPQISEDVSDTGNIIMNCCISLFFEKHECSRLSTQ